MSIIDKKKQNISVVQDLLGTGKYVTREKSSMIELLQVCNSLQYFFFRPMEKKLTGGFFFSSLSRNLVQKLN